MSSSTLRQGKRAFVVSYLARSSPDQIGSDGKGRNVVINLREQESERCLHAVNLNQRRM